MNYTSIDLYSPFAIAVIIALVVLAAGCIVLAIIGLLTSRRLSRFIDWLSIKLQHKD